MDKPSSSFVKAIKLLLSWGREARTGSDSFGASSSAATERDGLADLERQRVAAGDEALSERSP
jgi:hypothetical protein